MRHLLPLLIVGLFASFVAAQTSAKPNHVHTHTAGSAPLTGANVPDIVAQRLVLINLGVADSLNAKTDDLVAQRAFIGSIGLSSSEQAALLRIANDFAATWKARFEAHNRDLTSGIALPMAQFKTERDALVKTKMDEVAGALTPYGFARFTTYIQMQKQFMQTWEGQ